MEITIDSKIWKIVGIDITVIVVFLIIQGVANGKKSEEDECVNGACAVEEVQENKIQAEKIEVVHFHATQQCWSCMTVGDFAKKTLQERFPEEYGNGKIVFKDINLELPENEEIVKKYKASGSSLFVNYIYDGQDHISEEIQVWYLTSSESQFKKYLGDKLEKYL